MSFSAPTPPDPTTTSNAQQGYNTGAATSQNTINSYNQSNPYGSISYTADPNSPSGYSLNSTLSAGQQGLYNTQTANQQSAGNAAGNLLGDSSVTGAFNPNNSTVANSLNSMSQQYLQPIYNQQQSNLNASLVNQGLAPGSEAYNNAQNLLARNQGDTTNQYLQQNESTAYNQALSTQQQNYSQLAGLYGISGATSPTQLQTPTSQVQPANYAGAVQSNYQAQNANYDATLSGLFGIGTGLAGGLGKGLFSSGSGTGGVASTINYGGQSWPSYS